MRKKGRGSRQITASVPFVVSLRTAQSVYEGAAATTTVLSVPVDRSGNIGYAGQVQWGVSGYGPSPATIADFGGTYPSAVIQFGPNDMVVNIDITIYGNDAIDGDRTFQLSLNAPSTTGGSGTAAIGVGAIVCTIVDDDSAAPTSNVEYNANQAYYDGNPSDYNG